MAEQDPFTGKFVKKFDPARTEEAVAAGVYEDGAGTVTDPEPEPEPEAAKKPTLRLQSKYNDHRIMVRATKRVIDPLYGVSIIPGLAVRFEGRQRIFDSEHAQEQYGWSDEERDLVERTLISKREFMADYYPAPFSTVPEHLKSLAKTQAPVGIIKCQAFGFKDGNLEQCDQPAGAGRQFCVGHDPESIRIIKGGGTTAG